MRKYKIKISEIYSYNVEIPANNKQEALKIIKECYDTNASFLEGVVVADNTTIEKTIFKIIK